MVKEIPLTQGKVALVDDDDYEELSKYKWCVKKRSHTCYAKRSSKTIDDVRNTILMHAVIIKAPKDMEIDHINGDGLDNRKENLRIVSTRGNAHNRHIEKTSKYPGVYWQNDIGKWRALIRVGGKRKHLGVFENEINAAKAYVNACEDAGIAVAQQAPAPTNHLAIPCPKCGKWIFRANVDEGYTLFCSDDGCGWKQKIVAQQAQQAPAMERIGSIRQPILQEDAYLIERVNAGMGEWEYVIQYCGEYYATAPTEEIARNIVEMAQHTCPVLSPMHDAALIAQEREKWERERDQKYVLTLSALREISADVELKEYRKSCIHDPVCQWLCTAGNCPFHVALDRHNATVAAQAREDMLKEVFESFNSLDSYGEEEGYPLVSLLDVQNRIELIQERSLRSPEQKQPSTAVEDIAPEGAAIVQKYKEQMRKDTIWELLKHFKFSCPGGELTPICDMCGANPYCIELRSGQNRERDPE